MRCAWGACSSAGSPAGFENQSSSRLIPSPSSIRPRYCLPPSSLDWANSSALEWAGAWKGSGSSSSNWAKRPSSAVMRLVSRLTTSARAQRVAALVVEQVPVSGGRRWQNVAGGSALGVFSAALISRAAPFGPMI